MSQKQQMRPIPLIQFESDRFKITQQATQFLKNLHGPFGVITIVGKYRTGKSLFLNKVLLNNNQSFKVCPTINSCTKGLWISRQVIKSQHPDSQDMDVIVIDTQGFGAMQQTDAYNNRILLFALLLSSYFIYNSVGSIDEKSLNNLTILTNLAKQLQSKNTNNDKIQEEFPTFMWVVRDFTLKLVDNNGCQMQPKQYLQYALEIQKGTSDAVQNKNKIRRMIKHFFKERDCYTLVTPVQNQNELQKLNQLPDNALRPQFLEQIGLLRQKIVRRLKPKKLKSRKLTGQTFIQLANSYIQSINNGALPNIESAWKTIKNFQTQQTVNKTKQLMNTKTLQFSEQPRKDHEFISFQKQLMEQALVFMKKKISNQNDLQENYVNIKNYICQIVHKSKGNNKKKSLHILVQHFQSKWQQFSCQMSAVEMQSKWRTLQNYYKTQHKQNSSLHQFLVQHVYPLKFDTLIQMLKSQQSATKFTQSQRLQQKNSYQKQIQYLKDKLHTCQSNLHENQRELSLLQIRSQEDKKIRQMQATYLNKQVQQFKQQMRAELSKNQKFKHELKQKDDIITQLKIKVNGLGVGLKDKSDEYVYAKKQLQILRDNLEFKIKQIENLKTTNYQLKSDIQRLQQRQRSVNSFTKSQLQNRSNEYQSLLSKYQNQQKQNQMLLQKVTKLQSTLQIESMHKAKDEKQYESMFQILKKTVQQERQRAIQLTQSNKNLAFAMKHLQQRFEQAQQKQKKLKQFKRCFKNSSCMQCQKCTKFFVPTIFPQHLNICILQIENLHKLENDRQKITPQLEVTVKQTLLKDSDSKPYTQYVLQVKKGDKIWCVNRKYKQFSNLHCQLKTLLPGINLSDFSFIVNPQQGNKKPLHVEQRRKILQKYLKDLCCNAHITQQAVWKQFIGDLQIDSYMPTSAQSPKQKYAMNELLRSSKNINLNDNSPDKQNFNNKLNHKTPQEFLKIWNQRNLRAKQLSKTKKLKN